MAGEAMVAQITSASDVLRGLASAHPEAALRIENSQFAILSDKFSKGCLHMKEMGSVMRSIENSAFQLSVRNKLMQKLAEAPLFDESELVNASKFQIWEPLGKFVPTSIASIKGTTAFGPRLIQFVLNGGLEKPSEKTFRELALAILLGTGGLDATWQMSQDDRMAAVESTKVLFRKAREGREPTRSLMMRLPDTPAKLHTIHPGVYQTWYTGDPPHGLGINDLTMGMLRGSTRCRKEK